MSRSTRATVLLAKAGVAFSVHVYDYDPDASQIGLHAAAALGVPAERMLKTLMALVDGKPVCVVVPSDCEVSMKRLAAAFGGKSAAMMPAADAERLTGYHVGGISPFGQKRKVPTAFEVSTLAHPTVYMNAGQRGVQIELAPEAARHTLGAVAAPLVA